MRGIRLTLVCISLIAIGLVFAGVCAAEIDPGTIVGVWLLDEGGGDVVKDSSGNGNDGKRFGPEWSDGKFGKALDFDGQDDYVEIPDDPSLDGMSEVTVAAWVRLRSFGGADPFDGFVDKSTSPGNRSYNLAQRNGQWEFALTNDADTRVQVNGSTTKLDEWVHLAGTYDGSEIKLYENGGLIGSKPQTGNVEDSASVLMLGRWPGALKRETDGIIDEAVVFNAALTEDDIKTLMTQGLANVLAVEHIDKLTTTWGSIRVQY